MDGWLHCLLTNCPDITIGYLCDWILFQTSLHEVQAPRRLDTARMAARGIPVGICYPSTGYQAHPLRVKNSFPESLNGAEDSLSEEREVRRPICDRLELSKPIRLSNSAVLQWWEAGTECTVTDYRLFLSLTSKCPSYSHVIESQGTAQEQQQLGKLLIESSRTGCSAQYASAVTCDDGVCAAEVSAVCHPALTGSGVVSTSSLQSFPLVAGGEDDGTVSLVDDAGAVCMPRRRVSTVASLAM